MDSSIRLLKPLTCIYGLKSEIHFARAIALDFPTSLHSNMNYRLRFEVSIKSSSKIHNLPLLHILIKAAYFANSHPEAPAPINAILNWEKLSITSKEWNELSESSEVKRDAVLVAS